MPRKIDLEYSIDHFQMTVRATKILKDNRIYTIGDLTRLSETDLSNIRGLGPTYIAHIYDSLKEFNLKLSMTASERRSYCDKKLLTTIEIEEVINILDRTKNALIKLVTDNQKSSE
jgi:pyrroline-5-carboxylate reductase